MRNKFLIVVAVLALSLSKQTAFAADTNTAKFQLGELIGRVNTKLSAGKKTEKDLDSELKEFDTLLAKYKDDKTDDVANVLYMKATLYFQVFQEVDKGTDLIKQLKRDFPDTKYGK